jgi:FMN phosphatase YigB (HAD superfamily)
VQLLPIPVDLPFDRSHVTRVAWAGDLRAITFDFGNTLVPVDRASLRAVVAVTAAAAASRLGPFEADAFIEVWTEERERQFREEVPRFREVDIAERIVRVLARLRGMGAPPADVRWDQAAAATLSDEGELAWAVDVYSRAFVDAMPAPPAVGPLLGRLANRHRLGILSNWPLAATIDRYVEAAGWSEHLSAVVISQRIGTIKPQRAIFAAARAALGDPPPSTILHVGDDWAADVVGASRAGWRTAYLDARPGDTPLPTSDRDGSVVPDLELSELVNLEAALGRAGGAPTTALRLADR